MFKRNLPLAIAISFGALTLLGLLFLPDLSRLILSWAAFLAAAALLLGVLNLFAIHLQRLTKEGSLYSGILILGMTAVFGLAITDQLSITQNGVMTAFNWIQAPLEAALASLLAFFLLFAGFQTLKRQRSLWTVLFVATAVILLISQALTATTLLPDNVRDLFNAIQNNINNIIAVAGMRGLLIGIALGAITLSLRLLLGMDQPYNK